MSLPADDLLSAFHDGEVNSAERAAVEQRLAASAEARRELSEIRQVSSLLKALPRDRLPAEFPQQVLQAIEREMLIPAQRDGEAVVRVNASSASPSRRWVGAVALLTSAAGLLLLVRAVDDRSNTKIAHVREAESLRKQIAVADSSRGEGFAGRTAAPMMVADAPVSGPRTSGALGGAAGTNFIAADSLNAPQSPTGVAATRESGTLFFDQSALRDVQIGGAVRAMQTEGDEVAVVWLTVVDRQEGLAGLQLLLRNKEIAHAVSDKKLDRAAKSNAASDQMHAVFVESDAEHLTAMLKQLRESDLLQSVEVDQPIELAQLGEVQVDLETSTLARRFAAPAPAAAEKKIASAGTSPKDAAKAEQAGAKGPQAAKDQPPNQVTLKFSRDALVQNQQSQQTRNRGLGRSQPRSQSVAEKNAEQTPDEHRPMQVLFVVVDQSQAGKSQLSPSNSSKPAPATPSKVRTEPAKPADQDGAA